MGKVFGLKGDPTDYPILHIELGMKIYGEDNPIMLAALEKETHAKEMREQLGEDPEKWRAEILKKYSSKQWVDLMEKNGRFSIDVYGKSLSSFATIFGVKGNPHSSNLVYLELAAAIYGEDDPFIVPLLRKERERKKTQLKYAFNPKRFRKALKLKYSAETWVTMSNAEKLKINLDGIGAGALGTVFGFDPDWHGRTLTYLGFGAAIYGRQNPYIKLYLDNDLDDWRRETKKKYSSKQWVETNGNKIRKIEVVGKKIGALALVFGIEGNVYSSRQAYLELGAAIYGEEDPHIAPALEKVRDEAAADKKLQEDPEILVREIFKTHTVDQWLAKEKKKINVLGKGILGIAAILGIKLPKSEKELRHLEVAARVYGADNEKIKPLLETARARSSVVG